MTTLEVEFGESLQSTHDHRQQLELEFHDCNSKLELLNEVVAARMEDLNWSRACFWSSGQDRQGKKKKKKLKKESSGHGLAMDEFLTFFAGELMEVTVSI